jgi:hypothetical protein
MAQYHFGVEGFKATLLFNGPIDGEPTVTSVGVGTMTQDPKVEQPTAADPTKVETLVALHFRSDVAGFAGISGSALADDPNTPDTQETVVIDFAQVAEWISPAQTKANTVSISTEVEPLAGPSAFRRR